MNKQPQYLRDDSYLYRLQSHPGYYFEVGRSDARQAIWGFLGDIAYVLHFTPSGDLRRVEHWSDLSTVGRGELSDTLRAMSSRIRSDLALEVAIISVKRFWAEAIPAGIEDLSDALKEFADEPESFSDEEQEELKDAIDQWLTDGMYVLWWEQAYEVNSEGEVVTS